MIRKKKITSLDRRLRLIHYDVVAEQRLETGDGHAGFNIAKGGDPMSHGSAMGSVKSIRGMRR
ncbi:hypothetical protein [Sphingobium olei]|uniref:Uncharacterized protein n=1 Tax=Sphingobium olei TaxID=420955 RepID=A0ABW3P5M7_9SPHN